MIHPSPSFTPLPLLHPLLLLPPLLLLLLLPPPPSPIPVLLPHPQEFNSSAPPKTEATPQDLITATKGITIASAKTVAAGNSCKQVEVTAAANKSRKAVSELLQATKAVSTKAESQEHKERLVTGRVWHDRLWHATYMYMYLL